MGALAVGAKALKPPYIEGGFATRPVNASIARLEMNGDQFDCAVNRDNPERAMRSVSETEALFAILREAASPKASGEIETLVNHGDDRSLCRVNALAFAKEHGLDEEETIAAFLHATQLGLFELGWNVLCPGCGGVLESGQSLKAINKTQYSCVLCATNVEPTLDERVDVTFTVSPNVRRIAAHDPNSLSMIEYYRQVYWSSGNDLPGDEQLANLFEEMTLDTIELPAGEKASVSLQVPEGRLIVFDPVLHMAQFLTVEGEPTRERQNISVVLNRMHAHPGTVTLRPGLLRISLENQSETRALPSIWIYGEVLQRLFSRRRPFLTAKRLLSNQTFRDLYRTNTIDVDQRLKIISMTFLFTDLKGSTELYDRIGDLAAYDLVRAHFRALHEIVAAETGAVVKTIGDAVMATFSTPDRALGAALKMREAMRDLAGDLILKIGIHEGPCLAVMLNDRQDYFGQTVNIASRVQGLATDSSIFVTSPVAAHVGSAGLLQRNGLSPMPTERALRGVSERMAVFEIS